MSRPTEAQVRWLVSTGLLDDALRRAVAAIDALAPYLARIKASRVHRQYRQRKRGRW